ncbi:MAG: type II toxin-antitoxin system VapC family toxin [Actinobacteria bacterium]|nr:type II toxin-antitoxin system VapC family toxin [Actinomycetota bacterium]
MLYFDTSALIKLVVIEDGSELVAELWSTRSQATSSILSYPEGRAALAAARRGGRLTPNGYCRAREEFESVQSELLLVAVDLPLARHAGELAEALGLRGCDAVHLSSALSLGPASDTTLVTWDEDLREAATQAGCAVAPPR